MSRSQFYLKRAIDIAGAMIGLLITFPVIAVALVVARLETRRSGLFRQTRMGMNGRQFKVLKIRTMRDDRDHTTNVTTANDPRITRFGRLMRKWKIDELPQWINILRGDMSLVGPRPDVPEMYENLSDEDRIILSVRPGLTGPAAIKYRKEEDLLAQVEDPERYNSEVLFPLKVRINRQYVEEYSLYRDFIYLWQTVFSGAEDSKAEEQSDDAEAVVIALPQKKASVGKKAA